MAHRFTGHEIELANGNPFDPSKPDWQMVDLESIAWSLASVPRYGGHARPWFSIAEHAVLVSLKLEKLGASRQLQMAALHHDDAEALDGVGDVQRPAKPLLDDEYRRRVAAINECVWVAIAFGAVSLWWPYQLDHPLLEQVDHEWALRFEARHLMRSRGEGWDIPVSDEPIPDHDDDVLWAWGPEQARIAFLQRHHELAGAIRMGMAA